MSVTLISVSHDTIVSNKHEEWTRHYYVDFQHPSDPKKGNPERKVKKVVNKDLPKLEEVEDDDDNFTPLDF